ncbi:MAG TPA: tripartite tricarboxylate transporter TctB family protein [Thermodesulfobacteriota bacterium]|nr:tripartite tricarboxylate transporter TctB family protein [Thermodesulfobacteriota bacterium]
MRKADQWSALALLFISGLICWGALLLPYGDVHNPAAGFFPLWLGIILAVMAAALLAQSSRGKDGRRITDILGEDVRWGKVLLVVASLVLYGWLMDVLGFLLSTFLLMAFLLRFVDPQPWRSVLLWTLSGSVGSYLVFDVWMKLRLPRGIWAG